MKEIITEAQFRRNIKTPDAAYIFFGDEDYLKGNALSVAKSELVGAEAEMFDYIRIEQADFTPESISAALAAPPMFGEYKLVTASLAFTDLRASEISAICEILGSLDGESGNVLIISIPSGGINAGTPKRLSPELKKLCELARVSKEKVFPHNLRHLFARTYYSLQKDVVRLADILGHSSVNTTRIYTMETGETHRRQIQQLGLLRC